MLTTFLDPGGEGDRLPDKLGLTKPVVECWWSLYIALLECTTVKQSITYMYMYIVALSFASKAYLMRVE